MAARKSPDCTNFACTYVALLRGVNVGGKNKLPMADLRPIFADVGCADVQTYIQSGNVVFSAALGAEMKIRSAVAKRINERFGLQVPVVMRTGEEFRQVATSNPFLKSGATAAFLYVAFLADAPETRCIKNLDPDRSPGDAFRVIAREIYLHLPNGVARSRLTNDYFDSKLGTISTVRNWRTVFNLAEMTQQV
jgi:uncharacterized protein (DUF1697 family)